MPRHPQPVRPIFQPDVIALVFIGRRTKAARTLGGRPTVEGIVGNKFIPGLLDHYLARVGYESQQTDLPIDPQRR